MPPPLLSPPATAAAYAASATAAPLLSASQRIAMQMEALNKRVAGLSFMQQ